MKYLPLPEPTIIDGRRLYTAGQMREYALQCSKGYESGAWIPPAMREKSAAPDKIDAIFKGLGIKK